MVLRDETQRLLEKLEQAIDADHLQRVAILHAACQRYEPIDHLPLVINMPAPEWPVFDYEQIQHDREAMLLSQLGGVYAGCLLQDDRLLSIRANYGTSIIPSLFGCAVRTFDNALPVALPWHSTDTIKALLDAGLPTLRGGQGGKVWDTITFFKEALAPYPRLREYVHIDLADIQGPFDAAEIIWGSEIFLALYDDPDLVHAFLALVTETIHQFILTHQRIDGEPFDGPCGIWGILGRVCVREDASVNLGLPQYEEFVQPYTQRLLDAFGGCIHWCGDGKAWWRSLVTSRNLSAVNPYQSEFYDPVEMHAACRAQGVSIFQWTLPLPAEARERITTGLTRLAWADDLASARALYDTHLAGANGAKGR